MGALAVSVTNQWATTSAQSLAFAQTASALQSTVLPLNVANSVGGGSGTPTAGNWLVLIAGWNQKSLPSVTMAASDDAHAFWRPGNVNTSTWAVSQSSANTRVAVWYTANPLNAALKAYAAPSGLMAGMAVLVVELSGTGPWDSITGINTNYAAGATTLNLALGAPSGSSFAIGAVCGDSSTAGQAFLPASWTGLHTTTATNGTDHTCDAVLTSAILLSNSGSLSVNGTATSATDLSGVLIEFLISAASPIPATQNAAWPYVKFEAAFGGGFQTPPDQLTWTDLTSRMWSWNETTGVQYQLGQIQATDLDLEIDNNDNALASDNVGSPYYSNALNSNMSFQANISPWTATHNATLAQSSTHVFASSSGATAQFSLQVTPDGVTATPGAISEQEAATVGAAYSASAWFYSVAGYATGAQVAITWYNSSHTLLSTVTSGAVAIPAATWTQVTFLNQTAPASTAFAAITVQFAGTPAATAFWVAEAALAAGAVAVATGLVTTGVPIRIRAAIGTIGSSSENLTGAPVTSNRWYVIQRNAEQWPQQIDSVWRRYVTLTATDVWSVMAATETTPYRGEVTQDAPYAWWAMDDQLLPGGIQPTTLRNIAPGNSNALTISQSPANSTQFYNSNQGIIQNTSTANPTSGTYSVAATQGWMYGDPQSAPPEFSTSTITTAIPGSASWQAAGGGGILGSSGWYLNVNDANFPALSGGVTVEGWFNYLFYGSATVAGTDSTVLQQPACPLTLFELATASAPVAVLQMDLSGHLNLITYNGATGTSNSIYTGSDLRSSSWHHVAVVLTTTTWTVYVDGGITALVSGTATGMTSAWTWLVVNGDLGSGGGSSIGNAAALVQSASNSVSGTATTVTVNLNSVTTAGNCLVVSVTTASGSNSTVTGITLGGSADHFAVAKAQSNGTTVDCEIWTDQNCAGGQSAIVVTLSNASGCTAQVMEFTGIPTSSAVDKTASSTGTGTPFTSTATTALAQTAEIVIGAAAAGGAGIGVTGPESGWGDFAQLTGGASPVVNSLTSYLGTSSTATQIYRGALSSTTALWAAAIVTLKTNGGLQHSGNVQVSHLAVYPSQLPAWRVLAHYWAAATAFGLLPAPANVSAQWNAASGGTAFPPDGSLGGGTYNGAGGLVASAVVAAVAGTVNSGPSAWATSPTFDSPGTLWVGWTGLAPAFNVYTATAVGSDKQSAVAAGSGDSFVYGFGGAGIGGGVCQTSNPVLVQEIQFTSSSGTFIPVTFGSPTTAGNCLVFCITTNAGSLSTVSSITLTIGGSADHFAAAKTVSSGTTIDCEIWTDANCAGGQIFFTVTLSGSAGCTVQAMEWAGLTTTPVDKTASNTGTSAAFSSGATAALAQASEVVIGAVAISGSAVSINGPASWGNLPQQTAGGGTPVNSLVSYVRTSATTAQTYTGSNTSDLWAAAVVTLKTVAASISSPSPPTSATATGDTPGQRIERCLAYGKVTYPGRAIDPATLLVQAATDVGGQQTAQNIGNIVRSDGGLLYVDNNGYLHYDDKVQLAAETAQGPWTLGPANSPYYEQIRWIADPHRIWNAIQITPFSPEGLTLASIGPAAAASVTTSQQQYGPQPLQFFSYLQSQSEMLTQANWLFTNFGGLRVRAENVRLDAAPAPGLWPVILGMNVGDLATIQMWQVGGGGITWTMRISRIRRRIEYTGKAVEASLELNLDWEPTSYWS